MQASYANDPILFERCMDLVDEVFPGCKQMALNGIKYNARWDEASTPFIVEEGGKIIAHVGVWPLPIMLNGEKHLGASIHGVCVKKEYRGKGLFKQLMSEALEFIQMHVDCAFMFTVDKPDLYKPYHFRVFDQYDFLLTSSHLVENNSDLRILRLDNANDLKLIHNLLTDHLPLSTQMSLINEKDLFILNVLQNKNNIYYSKNLNALIDYEVIENVLYIKDILSKESHPLNDILELIPENFDKVILQFCPDKYSEHTFMPMTAKTPCIMLVSESFIFEGNAFRYPEPYLC